MCLWSQGLAYWRSVIYALGDNLCDGLSYGLENIDTILDQAEQLSKLAIKLLQPYVYAYVWAI